MKIIRSKNSYNDLTELNKSKEYIKERKLINLWIGVKGFMNDNKFIVIPNVPEDKVNSLLDNCGVKDNDSNYNPVTIGDSSFDGLFINVGLTNQLDINSVKNILRDSDFIYVSSGWKDLKSIFGSEFIKDIESKVKGKCTLNKRLYKYQWNSRFGNSKGDYELYKVNKEGKDAYIICPLGFNLYLGSQRIFRGSKDECQKMLDDLI